MKERKSQTTSKRIDRPSNGLEFHKRGVEFHKQGKLSDAEREYKKAISCGYRHEGLWTNLGVIYKNSNRIEKALECYKSAIAINAKHVDAYTNLGRLYIEVEEWNKAEDALLKSIKVGTPNPYVYLDIGCVYNEMGDLKKSLEAIETFIKLNPKNPDGYMNLGVIYKKRAEYDKAKEATVISIKLKGNNPSAYLNLANIFRDTDDPERALQAVNKAIVLKDDYADAYLSKTYIELQRSEYTNASEAIDSAIKLGSKDIIQCNIARSACLFEQRRYREAEEILEALKKEKQLEKAVQEQIESSLKSIVYNKKAEEQGHEYDAGKRNEIRPPFGHENLVVKTFREVDDKLIEELKDVKLRELIDTQDSRYGNGTCSDFSLFENQTNEIQKLYIDLKNIIKLNISKDACSFKTDSFLNVFEKGAGQPAHKHIKSHDYTFKLSRHKYSLVYYLDVGDQDCENPGYLELHEPNERIKPKNGMIIIIPATRKHSVKYEGCKTRMMIGINFYAF